MKPGLKRRAASPVLLTKYQPIIDLLEDRLAPGSMLSLGGDFLTGASVAAQALGKTGSTAKIKTTTSTTTAKSALTEAPQQKLPAIVPENQTTKSGGGTTTVTNVFSRSATDSAIVNAFASLEAGSSSGKGGITSILGTASSKSAESTSAGTNGGSSNQSSPSSEGIGAMGSVFLVGSSPMGSEFGSTQTVARDSGAGTNGYGSNVSQLGGPVAPGPTGGILLSNGSMDVRTMYINGQRYGLSANQLQAIQNLQGSLNGLRVNVDTVFGTLSSVINTGAYLTAPQTLNPVDVVKNFYAANSVMFGLSEADRQDLKVTDLYSTVFKGRTLTNVYLQQTANGYVVDQGVANGTVVTKDGKSQLVIVGNNFVPGLEDSINTTTPTLSGGAVEAIRLAAINIGLTPGQMPQLLSSDGTAYRDYWEDYLQRQLSDTGSSTPYEGLPSSNPVDPEIIATYSPAGLSREPIPVKLRYLPIQNGETRLVYNITLDVPGSSDWFEVNVDAVTGKVWNRNNYSSNDSYRALSFRSESPQDGSFQIFRTPGDPLGNGFPFVPTVTWHNTDGDPAPEVFTTTGNNVLVQEDRDGDNGALTIGRRPSGGANNDYLDWKFDPTKEPYVPPIVPPGPGPSTPAQTENMYAAIINAYYGTNIYHDILYHAGFTESGGNFQIFNFGRGGRANDPVLFDVQDDADNGTTDNANFATPPDGISGRCQQFVFDFTTPFRDSSMDSGVFYHELTHGTSNRLVGGPSNVTGLNGIQSGGMGEGWSDFYATWITQKPDQNKSDRRPSGRYVLGQPSSGLGVRRLPLDSGMGTFGKPNTYDNPQTYNDIDPLATDVSYPFNPPIDPRQAPVDEVHNVGEIWAQTLWDMNWKFIGKYGYSSDLVNGNGGNNIALRLVTQGMALTPVQPTFLNARDAILAADVALYGGANQLEIWTAFAGRGMGQFSNDGASHNSTAVREDYTIPAIPGFPGGGGGGGTGGTYPGRGGNDSNYEPNNTADQAFSLGGQKGTRQYAGLKIRDSLQRDRDWFRFKTKASGSTTVQIDMGNNAGDLDLLIYRQDSNGLSEIDRSDHRQDGGSESVTFNATAGVQYFMLVEGYNGDTGNYGITITAP